MIRDQISRLYGANYFTRLDCVSGFHLIPVAESSIERTEFITPDGQYEFLTMPFGLKNAISVFQRAIMKALGELVYSFVVVYVDDILIISETMEEGIERIRTVLEKLTSVGFSLKLTKCSFLKKRIEFLGFEISEGNVKPNQGKIGALKNLPPSSNVP